MTSNQKNVLKFFPLLVFFLCLLSAENSIGQQFRMETDIYVQSQSKPVAHHITLFNKTRIYSLFYQSPPGGNLKLRCLEATILDRSTQTITILSTKKQAFFQISNKNLAGLISGQKLEKELQENDPFILNPKFEKTIEKEGTQISLKSDRLTYWCKGKKGTRPETLAGYYYYAKWFASLNVTVPKALPPFGRMEFNQAIEKQALLPIETKSQFISLKGKKLNVKTTHHYTKILSEIDKQRIQQVEENLKSFQKITLKEYRGLAPKQAASVNK